MTRGRTPLPLLLLLTATLLLALPAGAMPGFIVGKRDAKRIIHSAHIVLMKSDAKSVVTVMADYDGPLEPFAVVMPIPNDVTLDRLRTLKGDAVKRLEQLTAPRVHHFWEKDPCALGKAQQPWELDLRVKAGGPKIFSGMMDFSGDKREVPRELSWYVEPDFKSGEYTFTLFRHPPAEEEEEEAEGEQAKPAEKPEKPEKPSKARKAWRARKAKKDEEKAKKDKEKAKKDKEGEEEEKVELPAPLPIDQLSSWLRERGYKISAKHEKALAPYIQAGMNVLVAEVDADKTELIGSERALLSPIRYWSSQSVTKFPVTLGLLNLDKKQELLIYTIHANQRFEVDNYQTIFPPTNVQIRFKLDKVWVRERIGEIYANIHDRLIKKHPRAFLVEYAWSTQTCGEPCTSDKLQLYELLTLGGDELDLALPEEVTDPEPPELTEEQEEMFEQEVEEKELKPKEEKELKEEREKERWEVLRRKALAKRHKYVLSRVHFRYDKSTLTKDVQMVPAGHVRGGADIPKGGPQPTIPTDVRPAKMSKLQIRFNTIHPWKGIINCEKPTRWRWGKEPRHIRIWNRVFVADDLARRRRNGLQPEQVVLSAVPALGLPAVKEEEPADAGAEAGAEAAGEDKDEGCGCAAAGRRAPWSSSGAFWALLGAALLLRRRR